MTTSSASSPHRDYLDAVDDDRALLEARVALVDRHHLEQKLAWHDGRTELQSTVLSLDDGFRFRTGVDVHTAELLPLLDGQRRLRDVLARRIGEMGLGAADACRYETAALPVVRRLLELGFLVHAEPL